MALIDSSFSIEDLGHQMQRTPLTPDLSRIYSFCVTRLDRDSRPTR